MARSQTGQNPYHRLGFWCYGDGYGEDPIWLLSEALLAAYPFGLYGGSSCIYAYCIEKRL